MGNYANNHGGNSFFGDLTTFVTHPLNPVAAVQNKYQSQANLQLTLSQVGVLGAQQQAANAAAQAAADQSAAAQADATKSNIAKYGIIAGILILMVGGIVFAIKKFKKKKSA